MHLTSNNLAKKEPITLLLKREKVNSEEIIEPDNVRLNEIFKEMITYMQFKYALPQLPIDLTRITFLKKNPCFLFSALNLDDTIFDFLLSMNEDINQSDAKNNNALIYACEAM
ncbi:MAG: hypothetical protein H0W50_07275 [Parachlamydiaceae bacterium]|nr:hypothetical protein [Parachlamydiaceae bacterium]